MFDYNEQMANEAMNDIYEQRRKLIKANKTPTNVVMNDTTYKNLCFAMYKTSGGATGAKPTKVFDLPITIVPDYSGIYVAYSIEEMEF